MKHLACISAKGSTLMTLNCFMLTLLAAAGTRRRSYGVS